MLFKKQPDVLHDLERTALFEYKSKTKLSAAPWLLNFNYFLLLFYTAFSFLLFLYFLPNLGSVETIAICVKTNVTISMIMTILYIFITKEYKLSEYLSFNLDCLLYSFAYLLLLPLVFLMPNFNKMTFVIFLGVFLLATFYLINFIIKRDLKKYI